MNEIEEMKAKIEELTKTVAGFEQNTEGAPIPGIDAPHINNTEPTTEAPAVPQPTDPAVPQPPQEQAMDYKKMYEEEKAKCKALMEEKDKKEKAAEEEKDDPEKAAEDKEKEYEKEKAAYKSRYTPPNTASTGRGKVNTETASNEPDDFESYVASLDKKEVKGIEMNKKFVASAYPDRVKELQETAARMGTPFKANDDIELKADISRFLEDAHDLLRQHRGE